MGGTGVVPFGAGGGGGAIFGGLGGNLAMGGAPNTTGMAGSGGVTSMGGAASVTTGMMSDTTDATVSTTASTTGTVEPGPVQCISCAVQQCPFFVECLQDDVCTEGLSCAAQQCANASIDCVIDCYDGDVAQASALLIGFLCLTNQCGAPCGIEP